MATKTVFAPFEGHLFHAHSNHNKPL